LAAVVMAVAGAAIWLTLPQPSIELDVRGAAVGLTQLPTDTPGSSQPAAAAAEIVVDVEGAVMEPGLHRLPAESRVGDAIAAAGGYGPQVDIAAAAARLNLAERLTDGAKVHVPALGESAGLPSATHDPGGPAQVGPASGLVDLNHATADELDTLPGVGPVTAAKIIGAREEAPFGSVDELLSRGVLGPATFEKLKGLVTVTP
jgi:competence protein ComEA